MNSKIIAALIFLILVTTLFSQEIGGKLIGDTSNNSLNKNKLAFQYEAGYNFTGHSIIPIIFSLKYHLTDKSALRLSVGVNPGENGFDMKHNFNNGYYNDTLFYNHRPDDHRHGNIENLNFALNYMFYPAPRKDINLFFGLGPRFGIGSQHLRVPPPSPTSVPPNPEQGHRENTSWSLGLAGLVGVEWFAAKSISLFTEYNIAAGYQKRDYWDADYNPATGVPMFNELESSEFRVTDLSARLGFSIYFDRPF